MSEPVKRYSAMVNVRWEPFYDYDEKGAEVPGSYSTRPIDEKHTVVLATDHDRDIKALEDELEKHAGHDNALNRIELLVAENGRLREIIEHACLVAENPSDYNRPMVIAYWRRALKERP